MSTFWSLFIIVVTSLSLIWMLWLIFNNRNVEGGEVPGDYDGIRELDNPLPAWWVWMFVLSIVFAVGYLVVYPGMGNYEGVLNWSSAEQWRQDEEINREKYESLFAGYATKTYTQLHSDKRAMRVGRRLFINNCSTCHGVAAKGSEGFANLTDNEWIWGNDFEQIKASIINGRNGAMPGWGMALNDENINQTANYVLSLSDSPHNSDLADAGEAHFKVFCIACHGPAGTGNPMLGAPDLTNNLWLHPHTLADIENTIRDGRSGTMPAHGKILGADKSHLLAAYVKSLSQQ